MTKFRLQFSKAANVRFVSHLDTMKVFERAIRRANLPIAFSEGFNPHPKISLGSALAVGVSSEAEYADIEFKTPLKSDELVAKLQTALPEGYNILAAKEVSTKAEALMAIINRAEYQIRGESENSLTQEGLEQAIEKIFAQEAILILRETKRGTREVDISPGIFAVKGEVTGENHFELNLLVESGSTGNIRPDEVIKALGKVAGVVTKPGYVVIRKGLYVSRDSKILSPMDC